MTPWWPGTFREAGKEGVTHSRKTALFSSFMFDRHAALVYGILWLNVFHEELLLVLELANVDIFEHSRLQTVLAHAQSQPSAKACKVAGNDTDIDRHPVLILEDILHYIGQIGRHKAAAVLAEEMRILLRP
jgi:hypothetical protein